MELSVHLRSSERVNEFLIMLQRAVHIHTAIPHQTIAKKYLVDFQISLEGSGSPEDRGDNDYKIALRIGPTDAARLGAFAATTMLKLNS